MNKDLFASNKTPSVPAADTINLAGGKAYSLTDKAALAQIVSTSCLGSTFYANAGSQLDDILKLCDNVPAKFIAQAAIYARNEGLMKDTPAILCAVLAKKDVSLLKSIFNRVIDNGRMLRGFMTIIRSNKAGRKSLGTSIKKLIQKWFDSRSNEQLFADSVGADGASIADCIKLAHPVPRNSEIEALYAYIIGKKVVTRQKDMVKNERIAGRYETVLLSALPKVVQDYEQYKAKILAGEDAGEIPKVEWRFLTALNLKPAQWKQIAANAPWQMTRMNLNTFARHEVFKDEEMVDIVAKRLADSETIKRIGVFPYQLFSAYANVDSSVPSKITNALQDAAEIATDNIPVIKGKVYICVDVSGSMRQSVTGNRGTATSKVSCLQAASVMAAAILRKNPEAEVIAFSDDVVPCKINSRDSIMTNAQKLANLPSGGTACGAPLRMLNQKNAKGDMIIFISDCESWADMERSSMGHNYYGMRGTSAGQEWEIFKKRNPHAKIACIDIVPNTTTQIKTAPSVLNVGGFSDSVFDIIAMFSHGKLSGEHFVQEIEKIQIEEPVAVSQKKKTWSKKFRGEK